MKLETKPNLIKFDSQFPIYNFFFPNQGKQISENTIPTVLNIANANAVSRALYFHIPFCDTICNFCPFTRGQFSSRNEINNYVDSLLIEIANKASMTDMKSVPISAIFFGGGTPSLLDEDQIYRIGESIKKNFDLSNLREFSFEIEVKSITPSKAKAMKEIGVTHPRFGLQSFNQKWRDTFDLTATLDQIYKATSILKNNFSFQTFDILYGMRGQTEGEFLSDLELAVSMGTTNVDIYPIDNVMTQVALHRKLSVRNLPPTPALRKFSMTLLAEQYMRHAGFMPHNGHGYVRTDMTNDVVSDAYSFAYHEHVYGYEGYDLLGFGTNAVSSVSGHVITNTQSRIKYQSLIKSGVIPCSISRHDSELDCARPLILRLPYHGIIEKNKVSWDKINGETLSRFTELLEQKLIEECENSFKVTKLGWYWYVNMMYYMMPKPDQMIMNRLVVDRLKTPGREFEKSELFFFDNKTNA